MNLTELYHERELFDAEANRDEIEERSERISEALDYWYDQGFEAYEVGADLEMHPAVTSGHRPALVQAFREGWAAAATDEDPPW